MNGVAFITATDGGHADGLPARIDDVNWEAGRAHVADDVPEMPGLPARRASLQNWLEQIVATLPEPRQRLYDLFVARGLDSRNAARELGTNVAEILRLRRENRQAILRAFEVTALAAAEAGPPSPGSEAPGCAELRQILADAQHDGDPHEGGRRDIVVLPAALRLTVTRHLSQCRTCQDRRDTFMAWWAPELLPILADTEPNEQVMEDLHPMPVFARPRSTPGAPGRVASVGTAGTVVVRQTAVAGACLLVALLFLGLVWPGFLHSTAAFVPRASTAPSSRDPSSGGLSGVGSLRPSSSPPPEATRNLTASSSSASPTPPVQYTVQPSTNPTSLPPTPSLPGSAPEPTQVPSTLTPSSPAPSTTPAATPAPSASESATPAPSASPEPSSPTPSTTPAATPAPSASESATPAPSASGSATPASS